MKIIIKKQYIQLKTNLRSKLFPEMLRLQKHSKCEYKNVIFLKV